jgi:hypothetical protein
MENTPYGVQLKLLELEKLTDDISKLNMHTWPMSRRTNAVRVGS